MPAAPACAQPPQRVPPARVRLRWHRGHAARLRVAVPFWEAAVDVTAMLATGYFRIGLVREPTTGQQMKILATLQLSLLLLVVLPSLGEAAGCLGRLTLEQHQACQALRAHNARQAYSRRLTCSNDRR